jgi:hypothetical protein
MKKTGLLIATAILAISVYAVAGKEERETMKNEVSPAVTEAQAKVKAACGCAMKLVVDEKTITTRDLMHNVTGLAKEISDTAPKYCSDAASKKAVCQMKTLTFAGGKEAVFTFKGSEGVATSDGQSRVSWDMMMQQLDK